ncbi:MAG: hypothetical protein KF690_11530 [Bacteroidetes bacterium]|nr:hypothetical protein [Bacteroidota bacterium]
MPAPVFFYRRYLLPCLLLAGLAVLVQVPACTGHGPADDPPLSEFASLDPATRYVGQQACRSCHQEIYDTYSQTGMGRSWYKPRQAEAIEDFGPSARVYDRWSNYWYRPYWKDSTLYIQEYRLNGADTVHSLHERMDYIVGSGHQTRSYILERNGYLYEAPITWYVQRKRWDLSPGYEGGHNSRFGRPIGAECMHCHNDPSPLVPGTLNKYERVALGIGCERCHGPGSVHVARMEAGNEIDVSKMADKSIVNPRHLEASRQFDVCQQCHLQGVNVPTGGEFRPGMALSQAWEVFLLPQGDVSSFGIASHAARLRQSRCFTVSKTLSCTNCHDPHKGIHGAPAAHYRNVCQSCHAGKDSGCTAPMNKRQARQDDCAACHMPKGGTSDIPHVSFSDHYIRVPGRDPAPAPKTDGRTQAALLELLCATNPRPGPDAMGKAWLLYYEQQDARNTRYLYLADSLLAPTSYLERARLAYYQGRYTLADQWAQKAQDADTGPWPHYWQAAAQEAAMAYRVAATSYEQLFETYPGMAEAGMKAAILPLQLPNPSPQQVTHARSLLLKALAQKPHDKQILCNLGFVHMGLNELPQAEQRLKAALRLDPDYAKALENLVLCYHFQGKEEQRNATARRLAQLPEGAQALQKLSMFLNK